MSARKATEEKLFSGFTREIDRFRELAEKAERILITTHARPDGDAIGSITALKRALELKGKEVVAHAPDPVPDFLRFLKGASEAVTDAGDIKRYGLIVGLDHSALARTKLEPEIRASGVPLAVIDHHVTNKEPADAAIIVPEAAATCEILTFLLRQLEWPIDADIATSLLCGLVTDTGSFQHSGTSPAVLEAASFLMEKGGDQRAIMRNILGKRPVSALKIIGRALERIQTNPKTGAAVSFITNRDLEECGATGEDLSGVVNMLNSVPEANYSLLLTEHEGVLKGSLRSEPEKNVDVSKIALSFGGGGHKFASGFEVAGTLKKDDRGWYIE